ncbi:MAG: dTDP-4-dehydrorhamnose 3,5-epimerase family protein [Candidatus Gastranaerophilales bacterium]|nr:dTDP-4-dehydrorhamnose 3,5-epimerase family protein [Candidatus Gastranaerophilales bacterium]MDD3149526.1 dTDP-4-dehydrorhamnose 3,5-epimerase family protein [Candidatus Gastranaerophilales bacterium]
MDDMEQILTRRIEMNLIKEKLIEGVIIKPLKQLPDERGRIMHMLRCDDENFEQFGEIYFSSIFPNAIKGWHLHTKMTLNYALIKGNIKLVLYDERKESSTYGMIQEIYLNEKNYSLITVPPFVWNGFKGLGIEESIVANCSTIAHDKFEIKRLDPVKGYIPYDWSIKHC